MQFETSCVAVNLLREPETNSIFRNTEERGKAICNVAHVLEVCKHLSERQEIEWGTAN